MTFFCSCYPELSYISIQVNKIEVQYDKTSKQVDVQALKETLWDRTQKSFETWAQVD